MTRFRPFAFAVGGVVAATLVAVAPSLGSGGGTSGAAPVRVDTHLRKLAQEPRPWTTFLAAVGATPQAPSYDDRARRESLVASCMATRGFQYVPLDWQKIDAAVAAARQQLAPSSSVLMQKYGFGVVASVEGTLPSANIGDPNAATEAALDAAGRVAYGAAHADCNAQALAAVPDPTVAVVPPAVAAQIVAVDQAAMQDPRVRAAEAAWSDCMAKRGFQYADEAAIVADLRTQAAPLQTALGPPGSGAAGAIPCGVQSRLDALQARELAIAAADLECKPPLEDVTNGVRNEYEAGFVAQNGPRVSVLIVEQKG